MTECCVCSKTIDMKKCGFLNGVFGAPDVYPLCDEDLEKTKRFLNIKQPKEESEK